MGFSIGWREDVRRSVEVEEEEEEVEEQEEEKEEEEEKASTLGFFCAV